MEGGCEFDTFTLPADRCVPLMVKNLGRGMPERVVREEVKSQNTRVQEVTKLRSGRRDQDPAKDRPHTSTSLYRWRGGLSCPRCVPSKGQMQCKRCQHFGDSQRNCGYAPRCVACGGSHLSGGGSTPREQPKCCGCGGNHTAKYRVCVKWKEAKTPLQNKRPSVSERASPQANPPLRKLSGPGPLLSR